MTHWPEPLKAALSAVPQDVDIRAVRKVFNEWAKQRQPVKPGSKHTQLIDLWCKAFLDWFKCEYVFMAKDGAAVKKLVGTFEAEHVMRIAKAAWAHRDHYPCSMALTLPKLLSHINEIREWLNAHHNGKAKGQLPAFKQLEVLKTMKANHPCNPNSIKHDPSLCTVENRKAYAEIKRKIMELEQQQQKQALA